jgi:hypothetical protein
MVMTRFRWRRGQHSAGQDRLARRLFRDERNRERQPGPARGCVVPVPLPIGTTGWDIPERVVKRLGTAWVHFGSAGIAAAAVER